MPAVCIYGTVFNNCDTVEASVKSVWRPDAEIVVVDNYSTDGTWEKLLDLKKDFNLKLYRYKCSRGLGRQIALYKCLENSTVAHFDLDTAYNEAFHKLIDFGISSNVRVIAYNTIVAKREDILRCGGWRDLVRDEDIELVSRMGFDVAVPASVGENAVLPAHLVAREKRYGGLGRTVRATIDAMRGSATSFRRILVMKSKRLLAFYFPARALGFYRNRKPDNVSWIEKMFIVKTIPLKEVGIPEKYFFYMASLPLILSIEGGESSIDKYVLKCVSRPVYKLRLRTRGVKVVYFKDYEWLDKSYLPFVESVSILK